MTEDDIQRAVKIVGDNTDIKGFPPFSEFTDSHYYVMELLYRMDKLKNEFNTEYNNIRDKLELVLDKFEDCSHWNAGVPLAHQTSIERWFKVQQDFIRQQNEIQKSLFSTNIEWRLLVKTRETQITHLEQKIAGLDAYDKYANKLANTHAEKCKKLEDENETLTKIRLGNENIIIDLQRSLNEKSIMLSDSNTTIEHLLEQNKILQKTCSSLKGELQEYSEDNEVKNKEIKRVVKMIRHMIDKDKSSKILLNLKYPSILPT